MNNTETMRLQEETMRLEEETIELQEVIIKQHPLNGNDPYVKIHAIRTILYAIVDVRCNFFENENIDVLLKSYPDKNKVKLDFINKILNQYKYSDKNDVLYNVDSYTNVISESNKYVKATSYAKRCRNNADTALSIKNNAKFISELFASDSEANNSETYLADAYDRYVGTDGSKISENTKFGYFALFYLINAYINI